MSWLQYGLNADSELTSIHQVSRGLTNLQCPYCGGQLTAKKGRKLAHHFAHRAQTCRAVARRGDDLPILPLYDRFSLHLSGAEYEELQRLWGYGEKESISRLHHKGLIRKGCLKWNQWRGRDGAYEFTKLGKIPFGGLSLQLFSEIQQELLLQKLDALEGEVAFALNPDPDYCLADLPEKLTDFRLYHAQLKRVLSYTLYYLEVQADDETFHKIGVTTREIEERIQEIEAELRHHFQSVTLKVLGTWPHHGAIELYFKHRYRFSNARIGSLTEYFQFRTKTEAKSALRDLRRLKPKELTATEQAILENQLSAIEQALKAERDAYQLYQKKVQRSNSIQAGMQRAAQWGQHVGRPKGQESNATFLAKPKNQAIVDALSEGLSLRQVARKTGASVNTIRKVKALVEGRRNLNR